MNNKANRKKVGLWFKSKLNWLKSNFWIILSGSLGLVAITGVIWSVYSKHGFIFFSLLSVTGEDSESSPDKLLLVLVGIGAACLTFAALLVQYLANQRIRKEFRSRQSQDHFYKMLDIYTRDVANLKINSYRSNTEEVDFKKKSEKFSVVAHKIIEDVELFKDVKIKDKSSPKKEVKQGREVFQLMVKDFHFTFYLIDKYCKNNKLCIGTEKKLQLTYEFFFWGTSSDQHVSGGGISKATVKELSNYLNDIRKLFRKCKGKKFSFTYQTNENTRDQTFRFVPLSGHVIRLAHHYRYLYQIVKYVHECYEKKHISEVELNANLSTLRALMTNDEQLLLYYNYRVGFGANWDRLGKNGYQFLSEYNMLHNIPLYDYLPEGMEKPERHWKDFIAEKKKKDPNFTLFEWSR